MVHLGDDMAVMPAAGLREDVMAFCAATRPIDAAKMQGQWLLVESEEEPTINRVVELRDGAVYRHGKVCGRYLVFDRHVELWQDDAPLIMFWNCTDDLLAGAQDYLFEGEEPYRVKMILDRVKDGEVKEPALDLEAA